MATLNVAMLGSSFFPVDGKVGGVASDGNAVVCVAMVSLRAGWRAMSLAVLLSISLLIFICWRRLYSRFWSKNSSNAASLDFLYCSMINNFSSLKVNCCVVFGFLCASLVSGSGVCA